MDSVHEAEKLKKDVENAIKLIDYLERMKQPVPPIIRKILEAMAAGQEIRISASEAADHFAQFMKELDRECGIGNSSVDQDDAWICLARREPREGSLGYAGRLNFTLNTKNPMSAISIYWHRQSRSGWACIIDELRNGSPSGLYGKCFAPVDSPFHVPRSR